MTNGKLAALPHWLGGLACVAVFATSTAAAQSDAAAQRNFQIDRDAALQVQGAEQIAGSLIVKFSASATRGQSNAVLSSLGASRVTDYTLVPGLTHIHVPASAVQRVIDALQRSPLVEYVEIDQVVSTASVAPNDTYFGLQWALWNTGQSINGTRGQAGADIRATDA